MADLDIAQLLAVVITRLPPLGKAALGDHTLPVAGAAMTGLAEVVVLVLPPQQHRLHVIIEIRERPGRNGRYPFFALVTGEESLIDPPPITARMSGDIFLPG